MKVGSHYMYEGPPLSSSSIVISSVVGGYDVYKDKWTSAGWEGLQCQCEPGIVYDQCMLLLLCSLETGKWDTSPREFLLFATYSYIRMEG